MWTCGRSLARSMTQDLFADLYADRGHPVEVAPWRLALVMVMQYIEGLTDRQAADAVRRCIDWKYALSLELTDAGFDFTLLHDFRERLLAHDAAQRLLDTFLEACKARGWLKARGTQRTDSTHVLAAIRTLHRLERVLETLRAALNQLSAADAAWVQRHVPVAWYERYGPRAESMRLPKEASKRDALAVQIGAEGYALLDSLFGNEDARHLRQLPAAGDSPAGMGATILSLYGTRHGSGALARPRRAAASSPPDSVAV